MTEDAPTPTHFVARDRARRFARYLREALQERKLHYRGADVGMTSLVDEAEAALAAVVEDARGTVADILAGRIRDRERGFMEVPLVTATEGLLDRVDLARRMDKARTLGGIPEGEARAAVLALLDEALLRLDAYCGSYDEKRPVGPARRVDVAHALNQVERHNAWERALSDPRAVPPPAYDREPPDVESDPNALEDLLRAARDALPSAAGPWHVTPAAPGRPLTLVLGEASGDAQALPPTERMARAREVLAFMHPVTLTCVGRPGLSEAGLLSADAVTEAEIEAITIGLADDGAEDADLHVMEVAGAEAELDPEHEKAVRALLTAAPLPADGPPPPMRLVALMGVLRALDQVLAGRVLARAGSGAVRVAASRLPRETTRKAPLLRSVTAQLEQRFRAFPTHRVDDIATAAADGKLAKRHAVPADVAVLLALLGRSWNAGGRAIARVVDLAPLSDADVEAVVQELCLLAAVRRDLDAGRDVDTGRLGRLEKATIAVLGQLGRVPPA